MPFGVNVERNVSDCPAKFEPAKRFSGTFFILRVKQMSKYFKPQNSGVLQLRPKVSSNFLLQYT